jgi:hypothetical protein
LSANAPWAVEILHTQRDDARVYELIGPGTAQPGLADALAGLQPAASVTGPSTELTWSFPSARRITQLSLGQAAATAGPTTGVELQVEQPDGRWIVEARAASGVGDGTGRAPYLLAVPATPIPVIALRVVVDGPTADAGAQVTDVAAIGSAPSGA